MILLSNEAMITILKSKTLSKIYAELLYAYVTTQREQPSLDGISFSLDNLCKALHYANKSTVSRGLKVLQSLGVIKVVTSNQGTTVIYGSEKINIW